jgi:hypothetical protein
MPECGGSELDRRGKRLLRRLLSVWLVVVGCTYDPDNRCSPGQVVYDTYCVCADGSAWTPAGCVVCAEDEVAGPDGCECACDDAGAP